MNEERNWGIFKIIPNPDGKKPDKVPMDLQSGKTVAAKEAFVHTLDDAKAALNGGSTELGYLPREDSVWVGIDMDDCVKTDKALEGWADDLLGDTDVPNGITPSGRGLRLLQPRDIHDQITGGAGERNGVGFFTTDGRAFTVPLELDEKLDEVERDDAFVDRLLVRLGPKNYVTDAQRKAFVEAFEGKWNGHWLFKLPETRQRAAVEHMLFAIGPVEEYHQWLEISMGLHQLDGYVDWSVEEVWEHWCRTDDVGYNPRKNIYFWQKFHDSKGVSFWTVLHYAKEAGFDIKPWQKETQTAALAARWAGFSFPEQTEVIETIEEEDTVDLT